MITKFDLVLLCLVIIAISLVALAIIDSILMSQIQTIEHRLDILERLKGQAQI